MPTSNSGGTGICVVPRRMLDNTPGAILQPQPPPWLSEVRRGSAVLGEVEAVMRSIVAHACDY